MSVYPRATVENMPVIVKKGTTIFTSGVAFVSLQDPAQPDGSTSFTPAVLDNGQTCIALANLTRGPIYRVWAQVTYLGQIVIINCGLYEVP